MWGAFTAMLKVINLKRVCPVCKNAQVVAAEDKNKTVICKNCGADIPPPRIK